jgi:uncharacterized membrane protein
LRGTQYRTVDDKHVELRLSARSFERSRERARLHVLLLAGSEVDDDDDLLIDDGRARTPEEKRAQLQTEGTSDRATATVSLLPRRSGTIPAAALTSLATAIVLGIFSFRLRDLDGQTGAAVLLLLPAVVATYLSRPGEHRFTTRSLRATRVLALCSAACAVVLSGLIAGGFLSSGSVSEAAAPLAKVDAHSPSSQTCTTSGRRQLRSGGSTRPLPLTLRCRPRGALAVAARLYRAPERRVPPVAKYTAWLLAVASGVLALILVLAWGAGTLTLRSVPSDAELSIASRIPAHPRPGFKP